MTTTKRKPAAADEPLQFADAAAWQHWLQRHHATSDGVWLRIAKKGAGAEPTVSYGEALDIALCHGWIDGRKQGGEPYWLQRFTPRRARSIWSKTNCAKAEALIAQGRMQPAGLKEVERAKADGRWQRAYDSPAQASVLPDLQAALDAEPAARASFGTLNSANRYAVLWRVQTAKRPETRARRIAQLVAMLARGEVFHPSGRRSGQDEGS
jgi:uncharacterized protein YdeI (YjbR/CyaY-like superfamily)